MPRSLVNSELLWRGMPLPSSEYGSPCTLWQLGPKMKAVPTSRTWALFTKQHTKRHNYIDTLRQPQSHMKQNY